MILVIDNYDSFTYNLVQYLGELGADLEVYRNDKITIEKILKVKPSKILISPGPGEPKNAGVSEDVIRKFGGTIPILGVCLGHQAIGEVFGGRIVQARSIMHGKISSIYHDASGIFKGIPNPFEATRYHSLVVERKSFPKTLRITAHTKDGEIMGLEHRNHKIYGVQFNPESILTLEGKRLLKNFLVI
ncbi:MAG: aminodeoxychorismate/anthranilate synthase component II [Candidatus Omnitrophica bacterium]|nr:aminodeoxychorismate/anthranilate synthase component II [Candidatus Omnitrophota bacterium]